MMVAMLIGIGVLILAIFLDVAVGAGLVLKLFSKTPDGPELPRYRGR